ncbi:fatty acid desaturase [Gaetbulibacter sp. M240]|uniref:fatty acid desaturase family protein n=1 Tax=Gaetbulibacter sp. M240 TaxID=3126511 RepID=UPI00374FA45E
METQIIFKQNLEDNIHFRTLRNRLKNVIRSLPDKRKHQKIYAVILMPLAFIAVYLLALNFKQNAALFYTFYAFLGIISVLIFVSLIHDAIHHNIFKKRGWNNALIILFDLLGGNSYIWKKRHVLLHHNYQNIAGWDSDIEQTGLIKVFKHEKATFISRNQSWLIFFLYPMYLLNWILLRDFKDFFLKKRAIKKVCKIPTIEYFKLFLFKGLFLFYTVFIPVILGVEVYTALLGLFIMFTVGSIFALVSLLPPHVNDKSEFPVPNDHGQLESSWFAHQFDTTNDVILNNWFTRNIMGNFNFHLAHHLFPNISSVYAPEVTREIANYAKEHGFQYRSYKLQKALYYHYQLIKENAIDEDFFEEDM